MMIAYKIKKVPRGPGHFFRYLVTGTKQFGLVRHRQRLGQALQAVRSLESPAAVAPVQVLQVPAASRQAVQTDLQVA